MCLGSESVKEVGRGGVWNILEILLFPCSLHAQHNRTWIRRATCVNVKNTYDSSKISCDSQWSLQFFSFCVCYILLLHLSSMPLNRRASLWTKKTLKRSCTRRPENESKVTMWRQKRRAGRCRHILVGRRDKIRAKSFSSLLSNHFSPFFLPAVNSFRYARKQDVSEKNIQVKRVWVCLFGQEDCRCCTSAKDTLNEDVLLAKDITQWRCAADWASSAPLAQGVRGQGSTLASCVALSDSMSCFCCAPERSTASSNATCTATACVNT